MEAQFLTRRSWCKRNDLPEMACKQMSHLSPYLENQGLICVPWRFQWIIKHRLAVMAWPQYPEHLRFLLKCGIRRLVCLSPECRPPIHLFTEFYFLEIPIEELEAPTLDNIKLFICFCEQARKEGEAVGVHCRVGRGRSGVLAASYLLRFCGMTDEQVILQMRTIRPFSIESIAQEQAIKAYYQDLLRCPPDNYPCSPTISSACPRNPDRIQNPC